VMTDLLQKAKAVSSCAGVFYWEPEVYGWWKPAYYTTLGWNAYNMGAFTQQGRPSATLDAFYDPSDAIKDVPTSDSAAEKTYDLRGMKAKGNEQGIVIEVRQGKAHKVLRK